jgi:hypothetical protein
MASCRGIKQVIEVVHTVFFIYRQKQYKNKKNLEIQMENLKKEIKESKEKQIT